MKTIHCLSLFGTIALLSQIALFAQGGAPVTAETAPTSAEPKSAKEDPTEPISRSSLKWKSGGGWLSTHEDYVKRAKEGNVDLVFFGDSITQWWDWKDFKKRYGPLNGVNFGIGGDKTQNLLWRVQNGEMEGIKPKLAVVMIGTNNLGNDPDDKIAAGIKKIVTSIQEKSPTTKVLLLGLFPRGWNANEVKWYQSKINKINGEIAKLDNGKDVRFANLGPKMLEADGTLSRKIFKDGLHLSGDGYVRWAEAMQKHIDEMMSLPKTETNTSVSSVS